MAISKKEVQVTLEEYVCDECNQGVLRLDDCADILQSNPKQYLHHCSNPECESEDVYFTYILPVLVYKEQKFMRADVLRSTASGVSVSTGNK